jgi:hypothetical protein
VIRIFTSSDIPYAVRTNLSWYPTRRFIANVDKVDPKFLSHMNLISYVLPSKVLIMYTGQISVCFIKGCPEIARKEVLYNLLLNDWIQFNVTLYWNPIPESEGNKIDIENWNRDRFSVNSRYIWRSTITIPEFCDKIDEVKAFWLFWKAKYEANV